MGPERGEELSRAALKIKYGRAMALIYNSGIRPDRASKAK